MGRHAHRGGMRPRSDRSLAARLAAPIVICVAVVAMVALGLWWWTLRDVADPIGHHPVTASAVVVSSPACGTGESTTVRLSMDGAAEPVTTHISGCGFIDDQRVDIEYRRGDPSLARLAGTTVAGQTGPARTIIPYVLLAVGLIAVIAAALAIRQHRRTRHRRARTALSVSEIRERLRSADTGEAAERPGWDLPPGVDRRTPAADEDDRG